MGREQYSGLNMQAPMGFIASEVTITVLLTQASDSQLWKSNSQLCRLVEQRRSPYSPLSMLRLDVAEIPPSATRR